MLLGACLAVACAWPDEALAQAVGGEEMGVVMLVVIPLGGVVGSVGAQSKFLMGEPSTGWGRVSVAFGTLNGVVAAICFIAAAVVDDEDRHAMFVLGGIELGIATSALVSGFVNEALAPPETTTQDPTGAQPAGAPAFLGVNVRF